MTDISPLSFHNAIKLRMRREYPIFHPSSLIIKVLHQGTRSRFFSSRKIWTIGQSKSSVSETSSSESNPISELPFQVHRNISIFFLKGFKVSGLIHRPLAPMADSKHNFSFFLLLSSWFISCWERTGECWGGGSKKDIPSPTPLIPREQSSETLTLVNGAVAPCFVVALAESFFPRSCKQAILIERYTVRIMACDDFSTC